MNNEKIKKKAKRGFTLVELVVVIAVIAILAAVSVGAYFGVTESASNSRLTQEGAQIKLNITLLGSEGKDYCSLNKDYFVINDLTMFETELNESTGIDYNVLANGEGTVNEDNPTINFINVEVEEGKYDYFEYANPDVVDKYIKVNIISGDNEIIKSNIEINNGDNSTEETITRDVDKIGNVIFNFPVKNEPLDQYVGIKIVTDEFNVVSGAYTLSLKDLNNCYSDAYNQTKTGMFKVGDLTNPGSFNFTVPNEVKSVIIRVGAHKTSNESMISINDSEGIEITHFSGMGKFEAIEISTVNNKNISFKTLLGNETAHKVALISSIEYVF